MIGGAPPGTIPAATSPLRAGVVFETLDITEVHRIRPLWERLKQHHGEVSTFFAERHAGIGFDERLTFLHAHGKDLFRLDVARLDGTDTQVGYCLSSIAEGRRGEVESIYVDADWRGQGLGRWFMEAALAWFDERGAEQVILGVVAGNDRALGFYERFGFFPRTTVLMRRKPTG